VAVPVGALLEGISDFQDNFFLKRFAVYEKADGQLPSGESAGHIQTA
jgi:hypothetical protein